MPKVVVQGMPGLDGEYELDLEFTHRDFRTIKQLTGVRANEVMEALQAGDLDIVVALAEIAMQRNGKPHDIDQLWDAKAGSITLEFDEAEVEEETPPSAAGEPETGGARPSSGDSTRNGTDALPVTSSPGGSGTRLPASISGRPTSQT